MKKIMFVCYGNICRSPLAEFLMKDYVKKQGKEKEYYISSSATSYEEIGSNVYYAARPYLDRLNIDYSEKRAVKLQKEDYNNYDYFIGMDRSNILNMKRIFNVTDSEKIRLLLSFNGTEEEIDDPWYTRDFEKAFNQIYEGVKSLFKYLEKNK